MLLLKLFAAWLLADFFAGVVHWWEDRFLALDSRFAFLRSLAKDNDKHHRKPAAMVRMPPIDNLSTSAPFGLALSAGTMLAGAPDIIWMALFFASFGNLVHRYAHAPKTSVPAFVHKCQSIGLMISSKHHHRHHIGVVLPVRAKSHYCPMTDYLNPILDGIGFWRKLEMIVGRKNEN